MTAACSNSLSVSFLPAAPQWLQLNIRKKSNTSYPACSTCSYFTVTKRVSGYSQNPLEKHWHISFHSHISGVNNNKNYTRLFRWFPVLQSTCPCILEVKLTGPYLSQMQPQILSWSCIPHNSYQIPTLVMQFHYTSGCSTCCDLVDILQTS